MNKRTKLTSLLLAGAMTLTLSACGGAAQNSPASSTGAASSADAPAASAAELREQVLGAETAAFLDAVDVDYAYDLTYKLSTDPAYLTNEMGFRTSGSDAEHAAADFLAEEMASIGLTDVQKVAVDVDKWQFNGASLTIEGTDVEMMPVSYMLNGTDAAGITAEIVDCGTGFAADYEGKDVTGKIALVGVDQYNEAWIDQYIYEAREQGAAALVTYDVDGYAAYSDDMINIQDVCCEDVMPTVAISANQYRAIAAAIADGHTTACLTVDSVMEPGTSYDVIGRIKGRSSEQQILFAGHYDMYFNGFQDDCSSMGVIFAVAKAMTEAGYVPENDIVFVAHGAEEWGATGTEFDWTRGAWELINNVYPEWGGKTLALFNFELAAFYEGAEQFQVSCVPEFAPLVRTLAETSDTLKGAVDGIFTDGLSGESVDTTTMEDGVSYRASGVPYFINVTGTCAGDGDSDTVSWTEQHYHTQSDDASTYSAEVMGTNIRFFGALAQYVDQTPALELDFTAACDDLAEALGTECAGSGADTAAYESALAELRSAAEDWNAETERLNAAYFAAAANGADETELAELRQAGAEHSAAALAAFQQVQDSFVSIEFSSDIVIRHVGYQDNVQLLNGILAALDNGELFTESGEGALDLAWQLNAATEYGYYLFSPAAVQSVRDHVDAAVDGQKYWGNDKGFVLTDTGAATAALNEKALDSSTPDFSGEIAVYQAALEQQNALLKQAVDAETEAMLVLAEQLRG